MPDPTPTTDEREWTSWDFHPQSTLRGRYWVFHSGTYGTFIELEDWPHEVVSSDWATAFMAWQEGDTEDSLPLVPEVFR